MDRVYDILERIRTCCGVYIGDRLLSRLSTFLSGYECAVQDLTGEYSMFNTRFQLFIEQKLGENGHHWSQIIEEVYGDNAFDRFYLFLEEFKLYNANTQYPTEPRSEREMRCYTMLEKLGIGFSRVDHEHADTIEACHEIEKSLGCEICKNLFLTNRQETQFYLLLMPGDKPFKTKLLSKQINSARLSFANETHMLRLLDITPGSVSVLGLMNDTEKQVQLLIDAELLKNEYLGCHPCMNTSSLKIRTEDIVNRFLPAIGHDYIPVELPWEVE